MALRNYLYAKHDAHLDISARINKVPTPSQQDTMNQIASSKSTSTARHIPRSAHNHHTQDHEFLSQQVNKVARDLNDFKLDGDKCTKLCDSCTCEKEKSGNNAVDGASTAENNEGHVEPSLRVEVADNEIDFTNVM